MAAVWAVRVPAAVERQAVALRRPGEVVQRARAPAVERSVFLRAAGGVASVTGKAPAMARAAFVRAAGGVVKVLGMAGASSGGGQGSGQGQGVSLPDAWRNLALPAGYLCPLLGQLALLRGEVPEYDAAQKCLRIGGRVLIGTAGKVFSFSGKASADMWVAVNANKGAKELALLADLPAASLAALRAAKAAAMAQRAEAVTSNAAKQADKAKAAAMAAEADFYLTKWGA